MSFYSVDGILAEKDAACLETFCHLLRSGGANVAGKQESQRPVDRMLDAYADCYQGLPGD